MVEIGVWSARFLRLSIQDLAALIVARENGAILLTGDRRLSELAAQQNLEAHGVLWLLDLMVAQKVLTGHEAADGLEAISRMGARLPPSECQQRLRLWRKL